MQPYQFQVRAVEALLSRTRMVLGSEPGTGKTYVSLAASLRTRPGAKYVLVVCPAYLQANWIDEIGLWFPDLTAQILTSNASLPVSTDIIVCSYERSVLAAALLKSLSLHAIIYDEADYLKNLRSARTKENLGKEGLARRAQRVYFVTGDPFPNNIVDCYSLFNFCLRGALGKWRDFVDTYAYCQSTSYGPPRIYGCKRENLPYLTSKVKPILHRDTIEENLSELPPFIEKKIWLEQSQQVRDLLYGAQVQDADIDSAIESGADRGELAKLRLLLGVEKVKATLPLLEDLVQTGPLVVFTWHKSAANACHEALSKNFRSVVCTGDSTPEYRAGVVRDFQKNKYDVIVATAASLGVGVTLTRASQCVVIETPYNKLNQLMARIHRIGQKNICQFYFPLYKNTRDHDIFKMVRAKAGNIEAFWKAYNGQEVPEVEDTESEQIEWDIEANV